MRARIHAVGRTPDVLPFLALGATIHDADSLAEAREAVKALVRDPAVLVILAEEFAEAADLAPPGGALVVVTPGAKGGRGMSLARTREMISRSVGVDLIAKAGRGKREGA